MTALLTQRRNVSPKIQDSRNSEREPVNPEIFLSPDLGVFGDLVRRFISGPK
jgi:hypothetical protein